jgi:hypothetical protein
VLAVAWCGGMLVRGAVMAWQQHDAGRTHHRPWLSWLSFEMPLVPG